MLGGEGLGQQDGGAGVDSPVRVEHVRIERAQGAVATAAGVVAHQNVQVPQRTGCGGYQLVRCVGSGEVELAVMDGRGVGGQGVGDAVDDRARSAGVGPPGLVMVVRGVVVQEQAGA